MLPKFVTCFIISTIAATVPLTLSVAPANAQSLTIPGEDDEQVVVVNLANVEVDEIIPVLEGIYSRYGLTLTGLPGMQRIVISGPSGRVQQATEVTMQLDRPEKGESAGLQTDLIQVHSYPVEDMLKLVHQSMLGTRAMRLAADTINQQIVVTGSQRDVQTIRELVTRVDQPTQALTADFYFLQGRIGAGKSAGDEVLPKALKPIAATLESNGFAAPTLLAPLQVHMDAGMWFESQSVLVSERVPNRTPTRTEFSVSGRARVGTDGKSVQLELKANLDTMTEIALSGGKAATLATPFSLDSTLTVQLGEYVLLAAAPHSTEHGDAVAVVVRITREQKR